jgi:quinol monooxygenase YgiN
VHCASIVLNVAADKAEDFERGFNEHELPTHRDLHERGLLVYSSLSRVTDISTNRVEGAVQYLVIAVFTSHEGHTAHDNDPRFKAWNEMADAYQVRQPFVFGGNSVITTGP